MNKKANFTRASSPQKERRHGPVVPLYELGLSGATKRHDAELAAVKAQYMDARQQRMIDALRPLTDAVRRLELSADRYVAAREARQAAEREEEPLCEIRQYLTRPIQAHELDDPHGVRIAMLEARLFRKAGRYATHITYEEPTS
jgi:hypothetical protein